MCPGMGAVCLVLPHRQGQGEVIKHVCLVLQGTCLDGHLVGKAAGWALNEAELHSETRENIP